MKLRKWLKRLAGPVSLCLLLFTAWQMAATNAYFSDDDDEVNPFGYQIVITELIEDFSPDENKKIVQVKNTGKQSCYVRVFLALSDDSMEVRLLQEGITAAWELHTDGYYYYKSVLLPGETTEPVLYGYEITLPAGEEMTPLDIIVYSEAVRADEAKTAVEAFKDLMAGEEEEEDIYEIQTIQ